MNVVVSFDLIVLNCCGRWTFTHVLQIPRKFVQFLPPMLVSSLLDFLQDQTLPMAVGYKLVGP